MIQVTEAEEQRNGLLDMRLVGGLMVRSWANSIRLLLRWLRLT